MIAKEGWAATLGDGGERGGARRIGRVDGGGVAGGGGRAYFLVMPGRKDTETITRWGVSRCG
ncbi:MAG: hypothetical protein ACTS3F_13620 [Phycisphaerales bacterium]